MPDYMRAPERVAYLFMQDSHRFNHLARRPTLRYSFYRAFNHHFTSDIQIDLCLKQLRIQELQLEIDHKVKAMQLLKSFQVPLQARLDLIIDNDDNFQFPTEVEASFLAMDDPHDNYGTY